MKKKLLRRRPRRILCLPDLDHSESAALSTLRLCVMAFREFSAMERCAKDSGRSERKSPSNSRCGKPSIKGITKLSFGGRKTSDLRSS